MNKVRHDAEVAKKKSVPTSKRARSFISVLNVFGRFDKIALSKWMLYFFFLTALALIYIGNSYKAEQTVRQLDQTEKDIRELRSEYISGKSELMVSSKQTGVAAAVISRGIKESTVAPKKIVVRNTNK